METDGQLVRVSVNKETRKEDRGTDETGARYHFTERSSRFAARSMRFPDNADMSNISARVDNGVLHVNVKKMTPEKARRAGRLAGAGPQTTTALRRGRISAAGGAPLTCCPCLVVGRQESSTHRKIKVVQQGRT